MLKGKRKLFFDAYVGNPLNQRNGAAAAVSAGYAKKSAKQRAYQLLHNDEEMIAAIREHDEEQHERNTARENEIVEFLTSVMRGEEVENIPLFVGDGEQEFKEGAPSARDRLKAAELLGKHYAMFTEKTEIDGGKVVIINDIPRGDGNADG